MFGNLLSNSTKLDDLNTFEFVWKCKVIIFFERRNFPMSQILWNNNLELKLHFLHLTRNLRRYQEMLPISFFWRWMLFNFIINRQTYAKGNIVLIRKNISMTFITTKYVKTGMSIYYIEVNILYILYASTPLILYYILISCHMCGHSGT